MEDIPAAGFVGMHGRAGGDVGADHRHRIAFPPDNPCPRVAVALARDDDDLALSVEGAAVNAIGLPIRLARTLAEISAVNFGLPIGTADLVATVNLSAHCFAQLVQQHESALRVDVHVAGHVQRRDAFDAVAVNSAITAR